MVTRRAPVGLFVEAEEQYGVRRIVATPVYLNADGELRSPRFEWSGRYNDLADLEISAFVDIGSRPVNGGRPYGFQTQFAPYRVELRQAEVMVKTLRKLRRGLETLDRERGYVADGDLLAYLTRVAEVLGLTGYFVRSTPVQQELTGQRFRRLDGGGLQDWLNHAVYAHAAAASPSGSESR